MYGPLSGKRLPGGIPGAGKKGSGLFKRQLSGDAEGTGRKYAKGF